MNFRGLSLPGVVEIVADRIGDDRGFFSETYNSAEFAKHGIDTVWVQDNHAHSHAAHVLRGMHYQLPPFAQQKLLRVTRGAVFDAIVDVRRESPTFGQWTAVELSAGAWNQVFIPDGMAHGYLTLTPDTEVQYKVSAPYAPALERAVRWDDPSIAIAWPLAGVAPILSRKDVAAPFLSEVAPADLPPYRAE